LTSCWTLTPQIEELQNPEQEAEVKRSRDRTKEDYRVYYTLTLYITPILTLTLFFVLDFTKERLLASSEGT